MADESSASSSDHSESPSELKNETKKVPRSKTMGPETKPTPRTTSFMVNEAIQELGSHGVMSLQVIKKAISAKYGPISDTQSRNINKHVRAAIDDGSLVQRKGKKGITASFKLPSATDRARMYLARAAAEAAKAAETPTEDDQENKKAATITTPTKNPMTEEITKSPTSQPKELDSVTLSPKSPAEKTVTDDQDLKYD